MAIDLGLIHNVVRTYQRAFRDAQEPNREPPPSPAPSQDDRVTFSAEARAQIERTSAGRTKG